MEMKMELFEEIANFTRYSFSGHDDKGKGIIDPYRYHISIKEELGEALKKKIDSDFWQKFIGPIKPERIRLPCEMIPSKQENPGMVCEEDLYKYLKENFFTGKVIKKISGEKNLELIVLESDVLKSKKIVLSKKTILPIPVDVTQLEIPENRVDVGNIIQVFTYPYGFSRPRNKYDSECGDVHPRAILLANDSYGFAYRRK